MFEQGSFRLNRVVKTCQAKVAAVSRRHAASFSSCRQYTKVGLGQGKTRKKLKTCLQNIATNTFSHRAHRRRCSEGSNNNHASTASSDTLFAHPPQAEEIPELKPQRTASPSISSAETAIDTTLQPRRQTPALNTQQVNIQKIPARYRARIRQLRSGAADMEDSSVEETKAGTKPGGLPRSSTSYRLSGLALRGNGSNIPLPSSSSTSFAHSTASSRRTSQQDRVSSGSHEKHPPRRSSIVQRHGHPATEQMPETTPSSCRGFSKGTVNNPTSATSVASATPQRQLMQPLGPPFPRSQTLAGPALCPNSTKPSERKAPLKVAWEEFEDNNTENGCGIRDVEDEETVKILKRTCLPKSEIEKERKWKLSSLERFGNKDRVETASELPAEGPPEGGWLWDQDDARLVKTAQPQQYWLGRFTTVLNSFHHEDSFDEPDSATGKDKTSGLSRPTSLSSAHLDEHRIKRTFVVLGSMCATPEATESFKEFRAAYCRRFGDQWSKWLLVGREDEDTNVLGEMSRVFLKRGERRTPEPRSETKNSGGYGGRFNDLLRSMRRSLA